MRALPISQYPQIVPPEVVVSATYPGATAENIAATVAAPLEQQINGVERMIYMQSTSTGSGTMNLTVTFEIGTNPDQNAINVNNRVQRALPLLPGEVSRQGLVVQKRSTSILQVLTMSSPDGPLRHDLHQQLRAGERARRAAPPAGRRRRLAVRRFGLFDAHLAPARQARAVQPDAVGHRRRGARAEPAVRRRPLRRGADEQAAGLHLFGDDARRGWSTAPSSRTSSSARRRTAGRCG